MTINPIQIQGLVKTLPRGGQFIDKKFFEGGEPGHENYYPATGVSLDQVNLAGDEEISQAIEAATNTSGIGRENGHHAKEAYSQVKSLDVSMDLFDYHY
jgi:acyl-CoA reductase-like NAD-dependent aldehyde dehydrogenase